MFSLSGARTAEAYQAELSCSGIPSKDSDYRVQKMITFPLRQKLSEMNSKPEAGDVLLTDAFSCKHSNSYRFLPTETDRRINKEEIRCLSWRSLTSTTYLDIEDL